MPGIERIFVQAIRKYCADRGIEIEVRAHGWLVLMRRGARRHLVFAYDLGLNSAVAHRIANDKAATAEVLSVSGVPCVPQALFFNPQLGDGVQHSGSWEAILRLFAQYPAGVVVKPNEGTSGRSVLLVSSLPSLELAVNRIFAAHASLAISPYLEIEDEIRVVLLDEAPLVVYSKRRSSVVGDGKHSLLELALKDLPARQRSVVLPGLVADLDKAALDAIVPDGERRLLSWRHNLESGAEPVVLNKGEAWQACVELAIRAARGIGIRFASIDVVRVNGRCQVLEVNSGVMMEALGRRHPELVQATYRAALDKVFAGNG